MSCNGNCYQGRICDCAMAEAESSPEYVAYLRGLRDGAIIIGVMALCFGTLAAMVFGVICR